MLRRGAAHIFLLVLVGLVLVVGYVVLTRVGLTGGSASMAGLSKLGLPAAKKEPEVALETQYQNPFDSGTAYVNPFSEYKNPFDALK